MTRLRRLHLCLTVVWGVLTPPAVVLSIVFQEAIWVLAWIVFVSHYANMVGHFSAYQGARAEDAAHGPGQGD